MASKHSIHHAQVHVSYMCALCDNTEDVQWFCNDCQESLCDRCKDSHKRGKKTRNDDIVPIKEANKQGETIIPEVCKIHPGKSSDLFCSECDVIMCSMCFTQKHKQHAFKHIEEEIVSQKKYMRDELATLKSNLDQGNKQLTARKQVTQSFKGTIDNVIREVESRRSELKAEVDLIADSVTGELSFLLEKELKSHDKDCRRQEKTILEMKQLIRAVEEESENNEGLSSIFEMTKRLRTAKSSYGVSSENVVPLYPRFVSGKINQFQLKSMLGYVRVGHEGKKVIGFEKRHIDSKHVKQISTFRVPQQKEIISICPIDDKHAWMSIFSNKNLILVNKEGEVKKNVKLDFGPWCLALTNTGLLMTCSDRSSMIYNLSEDRRVTTFADISPLQTWGISVSDSDEVVVSTESPTILVLNMSGDRIRQLSCGGEGRGIVCLTTGHVAVVVYTTDDCRYKLEIKDKSDKAIHTWRGELDNGQITRGMRLCRIGRDKYDRLFVPDYRCNQVYVISGDGRIVTCLLDERHRLTGPTAVGVDRCGHVWIGCKLNGTVQVMEL